MVVDNLLRIKHQQSVIKITWFGLFINLALSVFKFIVGLIGHSQAVIADAFHSLSDLATDLAVLFGIRFWDAPADKDHPYGHYRIQTLITVSIGFALFIVALGIGYNGLATLREKHGTQPGWIALSGPLLSIILKEYLYQRTVRIGLLTKSPAVVANAWHHRSDALSSIPALIAVFLSAFNPDWGYFDHIGAVIVSIFILKVSWDIIKPELLELTEHAASAQDLGEIQSILHGIKEVLSFHKIRTRKMGSGILVDLHIQVDPQMSVIHGHEISRKVKTELMQNGPHVIDVVVHLEPYEVNIP
jgi:cation diffusion facilitator family transporter